MFGKLVIVAGLAAAGYWYWMQQPANRDLGAESLQENERLMARCIRQERSMSAGAALAGGLPDAGDTEALCADKLGLQRGPGGWQQGQ